MRGNTKEKITKVSPIMVRLAHSPLPVMWCNEFMARKTATLLFVTIIKPNKMRATAGIPHSQGFCKFVFEYMVLKYDKGYDVK